MRILLDVQALQSPSATRGIGRYTLAQVRALLAAPAGHEFVFSVNARLPRSAADVARLLREVDPDARVYAFGTPPQDWVPDAGQLATARIVQAAHWRALALDIAHVCSPFEPEGWQSVTPDGQFDSPVPYAATLYDLIPALYPDRYLADDVPRAYYTRKFEGLRRCAGLLAISESARADAIRLLPAAADRVFNVRGAADDVFAPRQLGTLERARLQGLYGIVRPCVLYTSGPDFRKNNERLIRSWAALPGPLRAAHQLVIVMALDQDGLEEQLRASAVAAGLAPDELVLTGYVPDADLVQLYALATLFVFPSLYEGFGLPVLEAMSCGTPCIAGNNSSLPEIVGRADALFDAGSEDAICAALARALSDADLRHALAEHGLRRAREFSWADCARRSIDAWESLHAACARPTHASAPSAAAAARLHESLADAPAREAAALLCLHGSQPAGAAPPRLLVDCTWLSANDAHSGIQRVVRRMLDALPPALGTRWEDLRIVRLERGFLWSSRLERSLLARATPAVDEPVAIADNDVLLMLDSSWDAYPDFAGVFERIRERGGRIVTVLYDTIPLRMPQLCNPAMPPVFSRWFDLAVLHSDALLAISRAVIDDASALIAERQLAHGALDLGHFVLGADPAPADTASARLPFTARGPLLTMVSTIEPRKGHDTLLAAFEAHWAAGGTAVLCLVGRQGWRVDDLCARLRQHPERGGRLHWLDDADDALLLAAYRASTALLFPSRAEGFGLGIVEAAGLGIPVVCSDLPVFREVAGGGARYVAVDDVAAWRAAIDDIEAGRPLPDPAGVRSVDWRVAARELVAALPQRRGGPSLPANLDHADLAGLRREGVDASQVSVFRMIEHPAAAQALLGNART